MIKNFIKNIINKSISFFGYNIVNENQKIIELTNNEKELINLVKDYSMTPQIRIYSLIKALKHINQKKILGDFVECGVWKGGNIILFKKIIELTNDSSRKIFAYDTFEGMTEPDENDFDISKNLNAKILMKKDKDKKTNIWGVCSLEDVKSNIQANVKNVDDIKFIKGPVEKTLDIQENLPEKISLLRLDTDWYSSTKKELEILYKKVSPGGVIIIDDYGHWGGSKKAVDEFFLDKYVWMHYIDYACRLIIKE
ncbi:TylF/MycF family methyltransferase [Pelagibacteraceae bacterium]|nr:TylF/MycF family methyltransferase [Pelagibacteraceae bacterium]